MQDEEFAQRVQSIRGKLYKTAVLYMESASLATDVLDEAIYRGLCGCKKLHNPEYFDTWITRIVINECHNELRRQKRLYPMDVLSQTAEEAFDTLPLKEAIYRLPKELKDVVILRYFAGFTLVETARMLKIPQGTAATRQRRAIQLLRLSLEEEVPE